MRIYTIPIATHFQIIVTADRARIIGIANPETVFSRKNVPKLLVQDPTGHRSASDETMTPIARCINVSEIHLPTASEPTINESAELTLSFSGRMRDSTFNYLGTFSYLESCGTTMFYAVHVEQLPNETLSANIVSDTPATANAMANFAENALTRSI